MTQVPGVSSGNNGYGQLVLDGTVTDECWHCNSSGYQNMLYFNRVMKIPAGGRLQVQGISLSHAFNMGRVLATSFSIVPLQFSSRASLPFVSLRSLEGGASGAFWRWKHSGGSDALVDLSDASKLTFAPCKLKQPHRHTPTHPHTHTHTPTHPHTHTHTPTHPHPHPHPHTPYYANPD